MSKSDSYDTSEWGEDCFRLDEKENEPCWGKVRMTDDGARMDDNGEWYEVNAEYACQGHEEWPKVYIAE